VDPDCNTATCTVMADPHITVFDGAQVSLMSLASGLKVHEVGAVTTSLTDYGAGDFWLVSSEQVRIQAHYMPDESLAAKNQFVNAVAVSGPFLQKKIIMIGGLDGKVTLDGREILPSQEGVSEKPLAATFDEALVHATQSSDGEVMLRLPSQVSLSVKRYASHVDVVIEMPKQVEGQDGLCGNFNGIPADDTLTVVAERFDPMVQASQSYF
jgi:hypothetical protein